MIFDNGFRNNAPIIDEKYYNLIVYNIKQDKISNVFFEYNVEKVNRRNRSEKFSNYNLDSYYWGGHLGVSGYKFIKDSLATVCNIKGDFNIPPQTLLQLSPREYDKARSKVTYGEIGLYFNFKNWHCTRLDFTNTSILAFKNKEDVKEYWDVSYMYNTPKMILPNISRISDTTFCSYINTDNVSIPLFEMYKKEIDSEDNPIIIIYYLK